MITDARTLYAPAEHARGEVPAHVLTWPYRVSRGPLLTELAACRTLADALEINRRMTITWAPR